MTMVRLACIILFAFLISCQLVDNRVRGSFRGGSSGLPPAPDPVQNALAFTGSSRPDAPPLNRVFNENDIPAWTLTGECDGSAGDVTVGGIGLVSPVALPCETNGSFSLNISYEDFKTLNQGSPIIDLGSIEIDIFQGAETKRTWLYKTISSITPTLITNATDLQNMTINSVGTFYILGNDIDVAAETGLSTDNWVPIGTAFSQFKGHFDGNNKTIRNVNIQTDTGGAIGFLGYVSSSLSSGGQVSNVTFDSVVINTPVADPVGSVIGANGGKIHNVFAKNVSINGGQNVGGLIGDNTNTVNNSSVTGVVKGATQQIGGVIGFNSTNVDSVFASVDVIAPTAGNVGGFVGTNTGRISNCFYTGAVEGDNAVGGFVGRHSTGLGDKIENSFTISNVIVNSFLGGAFVGDNTSETHLTNYYSSDTSCSGCTTLLANPKTNLELQNESTFSGWDFENESINGTKDIWKMPSSAGAPILSWQEDTPRSNYCWEKARFAEASYANSSEGATGADNNNAFTICTAQQMQLIGSNTSYWNKYFKLADDINLSIYTGTQYNIIGNTSTPFSGGFDGLGHNIHFFTYKGGTSDYVGLFGELNISTIVKSFGVINASITARDNIGVIVGSTGFLRDVFATGSITGRLTVGGLCGVDCDVNRAYSNVNVLSTGSTTYTAGIVNGYPSNTFSVGLVEGNGSLDWIGPIDSSGFDSNNYYATGQCTNSGSGNCNTIGTAIDTGLDPNYFFDKTNPPLDAWDFNTIWQEVPSRHPVLRNQVP